MSLDKYIRSHFSGTLAIFVVALGSPDVGAFPPPPPPVISSITPSAWAAVGGDLVKIHGGALYTDGTQVSVAGVPLPASAWIYDPYDASIQFLAPLGTALGAATVTVSTIFGSDSDSIHYVVTEPPRLIAPAFLSDGGNLKLSYGGQPLHLAFLLANLDGGTIPFAGSSLLVYQALVPLGLTGANGVGQLFIPGIQGIPAGLDLHLQVLTIEPPAQNLSTIGLTNLVVTKTVP